MRLPFSRSGKSASATDALSPHCANCASPLAVGQDWCLDCGTAVRGRLGGGPGIGSSMGVVGLTLLLVLGAVAAAYAALSSDSNKAVKAPVVIAGPTVPGTPDIGTTSGAPAGVTGAAGPVVATPITPSTGTTPPVLPRIPGVTPTPGAAATAPPLRGTATPTTGTAKPPAVVAPPQTPAPAPKVKTPSTTPTAKTPTAKTPTAKTPAVPAPTVAAGQPIVLDTDAATTYNPYSLPATGFTDPAKAIDGATDTAWTYRLDPATAGKTLVGLAIDMKTPQPVRAVKLTSLSPGMTVEFYGATGSTPPVSIIAPGWVHLANRRAIKSATTIALKAQGKSFRYLLVWITHAPAGMSTGTVGVSELSVSS